MSAENDLKYYTVALRDARDVALSPLTLTGCDWFEKKKCDQIIFLWTTGLRNEKIDANSLLGSKKTYRHIGNCTV